MEGIAAIEEVQIIQLAQEVVAVVAVEVEEVEGVEEVGLCHSFHLAATIMSWNYSRLISLFLSLLKKLFSPLSNRNLPFHALQQPIGYSNSDRNNTTGHGGEKSAAAVGGGISKFTAPSAEPSRGDAWGDSSTDPATAANTDDWGNTAIKTSDQDWSSSGVQQDVLLKETSKLSITKKGFTVVKV